jgi:hypothetical protein
MLEAVWCILNLIVGIPVAIVLIGLCREGFRALFALAFGFRVFEVKWGAGRDVWVKPIGSVDFVLGVLPLVGSIVAESGTPKRHRTARLSQASGPLLIQIAGALVGNANDLSLPEALQSGFAPIATLQLSNLLLIGLHGLIPFETKAGDRTDIRSILELVFGRAELDRHARASYYARYARHWLERADLEQAKAIVERGLTQLGRDSLLVACEARLQTGDLSSVIDQSECADALRLLIKDVEPSRRRDRDTRSLRERFRQAAITALPLLLAAFGLSAKESEQLSRLIHHRLIVVGEGVTEDAIASACEVQRARWRRWSPALDLILPDDPDIERDRHDQLARLERCLGRQEAAAAHQSRAVSAAQRAVTRHASRADPNPDLWLADEIRLAAVLRHAAELDSEGSRYRLALAALGTATKGLDLALSQITTSRWHEPELQASAKERLERERARLQWTRLQVLARMRLQ